MVMREVTRQEGIHWKEQRLLFGTTELDREATVKDSFPADAGSSVELTLVRTMPSAVTSWGAFTEDKLQSEKDKAKTAAEHSVAAVGAWGAFAGDSLQSEKDKAKTAAEEM